MSNINCLIIRNTQTSILKCFFYNLLDCINGTAINSFNSLINLQKSQYKSINSIKFGGAIFSLSSLEINQNYNLLLKNNIFI